MARPGWPRGRGRAIVEACSILGLPRTLASKLLSPPRRPLSRFLAGLRGRMRTSEAWLIALAVAIGSAAGALAVLQAWLAHGLQAVFFGIDLDQRLSAMAALDPRRLVWLPAGGAALGLVTWAASRRRSAAPVDVVEANALYGGVLRLRDSLVVCAQTVLSNGFGASVGLEAAYAQAGGAAASAAGRGFKLRRQDMRVLVGAGAGAAIGAAFGAPLTGAFYAFEIVIGSYTPSAIAPVAAACLAATLVAEHLGGAAYSIEIHPQATPDAAAYLYYAVLGLACAGVGVGVMRLTGAAERLVRASRLPAPLRPAVGGAILAALALATPQVLSAGHGALHVNLERQAPLAALAAIFVLKTCASAVSLGFGFRGGLFFASLFLGALIGQIYAGLIDLTPLPQTLLPANAALVGMGALAVAIVGGPLTMSFLVLESTGDFGVAVATLAAALVASTVVRERFGYSFSTWRLHLRGETIRSARDVGWMRSLTAGRMMRRTETLEASATVAELRRRFPLGSTSRVAVTDASGRYAGLVALAQAYGGEVASEATLESLARSRDHWLTPELGIGEVMKRFEAAEAEELAVLDARGEVLGLLAWAYVTRRYANELERRHLELYGEDG